MANRKRGERVLGPYPDIDGHRVIRIDEEGKRHSRVFTTLRGAEIYKAEIEGELARIDETTKTALVAYKKYLLEEKGNKDDSARQTLWAIDLFFTVVRDAETDKSRWVVEPVMLASLTPKRCRDLYDKMKARPLERTREPPSTDTHRSALSQLRTFLDWCIGKGWLKGENPTKDIKGTGKRRPRGKSLGKDGNELRVRQARAWYAKALELAGENDEGAVAALMALLLGMRASEIVSRKVADVDDDQAEADLLWIPCSKTPAGRRTLEVPPVLQAPLLAAIEGKSAERYMFECRIRPQDKGKPHRRDWIIDQVHRICDAAKVPRVTAHAMRGLLATLTAERGLAGHVIAATLGHEDERTTMTAYAAPGAAAAGVARRGLTLIQGGVQVRKSAAGE